MYTITENKDFHSLEIKFDSKPAPKVIDALKALRFRWHGYKQLWYGYADESTVRAAIDGKETSKPNKPANKFGVNVGDIFMATWGYEQTNNDFFQVVALVGTSSVRVRAVNPPIISTSPVSGMSEDRVYQITNDLLPAAPHSVHIKDQEHGDLKRLQVWDKEGTPCIKIADYATAHRVTGTCKVYESWYA